MNKLEKLNICLQEFKDLNVSREYCVNVINALDTECIVCDSFVTLDRLDKKIKHLYETNISNVKSVYFLLKNITNINELYYYIDGYGNYNNVSRDNIECALIDLINHYKDTYE